MLECKLSLETHLLRTCLDVIPTIFEDINQSVMKYFTWEFLLSTAMFLLEILSSPFNSCWQLKRKAPDTPLYHLLNKSEGLEFSIFKTLERHMILTKRDISRHFIKNPQRTTLRTFFRRQSSYCIRAEGETDRQTYDH